MAVAWMARLRRNGTRRERGAGSSRPLARGLPFDRSIPGGGSRKPEL